MRDRLLRVVNPELLEKVVVHFSRVRQENIVPGIPNLYYAHDLIGDPESNILANGGYKRFAKLVFVSYWQRDQYMLAYGIPYSHCTVIENAIEKEFSPQPKSSDVVRFIYHTTPHRGLELLYPIFDTLCKKYDNIHLDVFSSFGVYGWAERDNHYSGLFELLRQHPHISYHGAQPNDKVMEALEKSHIFLYPCIWQETSCIAMIEAIKSGVLPIHPNLAALPETASDTTVMYDYTENRHAHASRAYHATCDVLDNMKYQSFQNERCSLRANSISEFQRKWDVVLRSVIA